MMHSILTTSLLPLLWTVASSQNYTPCVGLKSRFDGYTYTIDHVTGEKVWSHCSFPSPLADHVLCGRLPIDGKYFLCDPENLLDQAQASAVDKQLALVQKKTSTICTHSNGQKESFRVAVALVNKIRIPDFNSSQLCINDCGQLWPRLDLAQGNNTSEDEQDEIMRLFAEGLRDLWQIGACANDVVVLYCKEFNKIFISTGTQASYYLPKERINTLQDSFKSFIDEHGYHDGLELGLLHLLSSLKVSLQGLTVAHIIVIFNMSIILVLGFCLFYYILVKRFEMNIWGEEVAYVLWEGFLKTVSGIWVIQGVVLTLAFMSHKEQGQGLFWALGTAIVALLVCIALYFISVSIYYHGGNTW